MRGNDFVEPLGMRVLIRKDESRNQTRGGIVLPDQAEIPTITGRVVEVSLQIDYFLMDQGNSCSIDKR